MILGKPTKFFDKYEELLSCSLVLFEKKLQEMLLSLAEYEVIYAIINKCLTGYNFSQDKNRSIKAKSISSISQNRKSFVAFSFTTLYEIYNKSATITQTLENYFNGNNYLEKYENFKLEMLIPLKEKLISILNDMQVEYDKNSSTKIIENNYNIEKINQLKNDVKAFSFKGEDRDYFNYFFQKLQDPLLKETSLMAIKYILSNYKHGNKLLEKILGVF